MDKSTTSLSLQDAAKRLVTGLVSEHDAEVMLAHAIEHNELHANVKRWATEQWEGKQLPGNINRLETFIELGDLQTWLAHCGRTK
ncbi:MAG: hypothetical protein IPJ38_14075 [Dechloromonas sp.]|jgi:hypothetical protein|uniref:Uncharacterized protein n=1 Tax=Candidatus Dechloromonas phosphorivorans TaxID=2899244 RepID=A0A935JZC4_9RHOO|nr:hypothetical protein [Candidatus Dechloromonas phosphorivorans]